MILNNLKIVFANKWNKFLAFILFVSFVIIYSFSWSFILLSNFYIRKDLLTPLNLSFLILMALLSSLAIVVSIYNIRLQMSAHKKSYGFLAIIPSFFASACPSCAPLIFSFSSTTFGIGMSLAPYGNIIKVGMVLILIFAIYLNLNNLNKCQIQTKKI